MLSCLAGTTGAKAPWRVKMLVVAYNKDYSLQI